MDANLTFLYRSSPARSLSLSSASGQLVHLVVQKSALFAINNMWVREEGGDTMTPRLAYRTKRHVDGFNSPITVFWPENAALVAVNSALPRLVRGKFGILGEEALMVAYQALLGYGSWWLVVVVGSVVLLAACCLLLAVHLNKCRIANLSSRHFRQLSFPPFSFSRHIFRAGQAVFIPAISFAPAKPLFFPAISFAPAMPNLFPPYLSCRPRRIFSRI